MDNTDDLEHPRVRHRKRGQMFGDVTAIHCDQGRGWFKGTNYNYHGPARYPVPAKQYQHRVPWWLFDNGLIIP